MSAANDLQRRDDQLVAELAAVKAELAKVRADHQCELDRQRDQFEAAVRALHESETRFRIAAQCASNFIYEWDLESGHVDWFGNVDEAMAYPPGGFPRTARDWAALLHPDDRTRVAELMRRHIQHGEVFFAEYRVKHRDGTYRYWIDRGTAVRESDGTARKWIGVTSDVTSRKKGEQEREFLAAQMAGQRQRLSDIIRSVPGVVWEAWGKPDEASQQINFVSDYVERMLGYTVEEWLATPNFWLNIVHPEDRERAASTAAKFFGCEKGSADEHNQRNEFRWLAKDGRIVWVEAQSVVVRDSAGNPLGMRGVTMDISARKHSEQAGRKLNQELEERVRTRTAALLDANQQMEAFCYTVSHDLRAPLRAMQGFTKALLDDHATQLDPTGQDYAQRVARAAKRLDALVQDLLDYSRLGRMEIELTDCSLDEVVEKVEAQLRREIAEARAEIHVERPLPSVRAHRLVLEQAITNLLINALKFVEPDRQPVVRLRADSHENAVRLWIEDNGIGIAPEHHDRIFNVFERLHGVDTFPGTGIGLAIVRKGTERMGGRVGVESQAGQGSRFFIELAAP